jgi:hypothetical protein
MRNQQTQRSDHLQVEAVADRGHLVQADACPCSTDEDTTIIIVDPEKVAIVVSENCVVEEDICEVCAPIATRISSECSVFA